MSEWQQGPEICDVISRKRYSWPYFVPKNVIFHIRFQTPPVKSIPILRPGLYEIMPSLLRLEQQQERFLKIHFEFAYLSLFGIETITLP